jgi:polyisoprenoid-binding protein YceI
MISIYVFMLFSALGLLETAAPSELKNDLPSPPAAVTYRVDAAQSKFMVHAHRGGLLWFKGNDHFVKVGTYSGEVRLDPAQANAASLVMTIEADSLEETGPVFTAPQKQTIKKELNDIVLEKDKYPQITFKSTAVEARVEGQRINVRITGNISLHGVTRRLVIPASVTMEGSNIRAKGHFSLDRKKFGVKATTAGQGTVRVQHKLDFDFDMVATAV